MNITNNNFMIQILVITLLLIFFCFLIFKIKNYYTKEYVTINIYDELYIHYYMRYIKENKQYYNVCVNTNYGDISIITETKCVITNRLFRFSFFNNIYDIYTEINKKIIFDDKFLNIKGYYTMENAIIEDKNKNKISIKYIKLNISKETPIDIKNIFDKITTSSQNGIYLAYNNYDDSNYIKHINFYNGNVKNIDEEKIMLPFFRQEKDMLWFMIKKICSNVDTEWESKIRILLHGPSTNGKSSFIYRLAMCLNKGITSINFNNFSKNDIYTGVIRQCRNGIHLLDNIDVILKKLHIKESKNIEDFNIFKLNDLLEIIKNPFIAKLTIATTTNYDMIQNTYPKFIKGSALKPIHFGYINAETLQDISKYFFGKKIKSYLPDVIMVPTSEIIDLALSSLVVGEEPFVSFEKELNLLL